MDSASLPLRPLLDGPSQAQALETVRGYLSGKQPAASMHNALPMVGLGG